MTQIYYFTGCCGNDHPFGITSGNTSTWTGFVPTVGNSYSLIVGSYLGCVTYSGSSTSSVSGINLINENIASFTSQTSCQYCIQNIFPCYTPPPVVTPVITGYKNECGIITILPMMVECVTSNPSSYNNNDGEVSVSITGGTAPYTTTWSNGMISPAIGGLGNGSYTATTVDYYGDYTATTVCVLSTDKVCTFSGSATNVSSTSDIYDYYNIRITGGTSTGPYTIYYNTCKSDRYIPYISGTTDLSTDLSYDDLFNSPYITVEVPAGTSVIFLYNQLCDICQTLILTKPITYKDFCLNITNNKGVPYFLHFIPNGSIGGYPSWKDNSDPTITITYDNTAPRWVINNFSANGGTIMSQDLSNANPPSNWSEPGTIPPTINFNLGGCSTTRRSSFPVSINQPTCLCDGSIIFNVNLDNPPFSYSIDNGVTYSSSPIFTNLCSGIYILSVVDLLGETFSKTITLDKPEMATTYSISLNTTNTTPVSNEVSLVNSYETTIQVTPPLPDGTTITFDLIHTNSFYSSPTSGTSVLTTGTILSKNLTDITINNSTTGQTQSVNTTPGCQSDFIYQSNINDIWNSITLTNTDTITISTTSRVDKTTTGLCVVGYSNDSYSIANAVISGCDCCSLIVNT